MPRTNPKTTAHEEILALIRQDLLARRSRNPLFSLRAYSRMAGLTPSQLSEALSAKRNLTRKIARKLLEFAAVDPSLSQRLIEALPAKQSRCSGRRAGSDKGRYLQLTSDEFQFVCDWFHFAILSLAETEDFDPRPSVIARRLGIQKRQVVGSLAILKRLGLLKKEGHGRLVTTGKIFTTTNDVPQASIKHNHAQGLDQAKKSLYETPLDEREISASVIAINPAQIPEAKARIRRFKRDLAQLLSVGPKTEVYRVAIQLFPLSQRNNMKGTPRK